MKKMTAKQFKDAAQLLQEKLEICHYNADRFEFSRKDGKLILAGKKIKAAYDFETAKLAVLEGEKDFDKHEVQRLEIICNNWHGSLE